MSYLKSHCAVAQYPTPQYYCPKLTLLKRRSSVNLLRPYGQSPFFVSRIRLSENDPAGESGA